MVADQGDADAGWVGERLSQHGFDLRALHRHELLAAVAVPPAHDLVLLLGSADAVHDPARSTLVERESQVVRAALSAGRPVLGICYGAQLAAHALGGSVRGLERGEVGWFEVTSLDGALCPPGPWLQFHSDVLTVPPGARTTGTSPVGPQGFVLDPVDGRGGVVAWQFHPETTPETLRHWVDNYRDHVLQHGADPAALVAEGWSRAQSSRTAAHQLVDAALVRLGSAGSSVPPGAAATVAPLSYRAGSSPAWNTPWGYAR